jgi:hypothetical protein
MKNIQLKIERLLIFSSLLFIVFSCDSQNKKSEHNPKTVTSEKIVGVNPKIKTKVNKQYDAKGNLIKFDSTYSYFYTSKHRDSLKVTIDNVFNEFKTFYNDNLISGFNKQINEIFMSDSLFKYDFLNDDYFRKRFELNMNKMNKIFLEMDSMKVNYLKSAQPKKQVRK